MRSAAVVVESVDSQDQVEAVGEFLGDCHRQCAGGGGLGGGGEVAADLVEGCQESDGGFFSRFDAGLVMVTRPSAPPSR